MSTTGGATPDAARGRGAILGDADGRAGPWGCGRDMQASWDDSSRVSGWRPSRVGKSALAQRLLLSDGIQWLPTDVLRTVLRRVLPELDELD